MGSWLQGWRLWLVVLPAIAVAYIVVESATGGFFTNLVGGKPSLPDCADDQVQEMVHDLSHQVIRLRLGYTADGPDAPPELLDHLDSLELGTILDRGEDTQTGDRRCRVQVMSPPGGRSTPPATCPFASVNYTIAEDVGKSRGNTLAYVVEASIQSMDIQCWHTQ